MRQVNYTARIRLEGRSKIIKVGEKKPTTEGTEAVDTLNAKEPRCKEYFWIHFAPLRLCVNKSNGFLNLAMGGITCTQRTWKSQRITEILDFLLIYENLRVSADQSSVGKLYNIFTGYFFERINEKR